MKTFLGALLLVLSIFTNCYADKKFDKDLKKVSKLNGFVDSKGGIYSVERISNKENTILILYNHGSDNDQVLDKCSKSWNKTPPVLLRLHDNKINNFQIKIYHLCSGVRGWTQDEQTRMWQSHVDSGELSLTLTDNNGTPLIQRQKQLFKQKIIKAKVDDLTQQGFKNIVLAGHSAGAWASITLKSKFPENIDGVIALNPAVAGTLKNRKEWPWWEDIKNYLINLMELPDLTNELVYSHSKDKFEIPETLLFLSNLSSVKFIDLSTSGCKGEKKFNGYHGITLTECFAKYEETNKNIIQYLESIF
tara:strand:+ start:34 stop:948 length:915 start_codon:yes stop_codon:yes gene_type:complete